MRISTTSPSSAIRYDDQTGTLRSYFSSGTLEEAAGGQSNAAVAGEFLSENAELYNLDGIDLVLTEEKEGSSQTTCRYEQYHKNVPVYGAYLHVTLRKSDRQVMSSVSKIEYGIPADTGNSARISVADVLKIMHEKYDRECRSFTHNDPVLYFYQRSLAWSVMLDTSDPKGNWELILDARDGKIIEVFDRRRYSASRSARIFWPDPVTSSKNPDLHWGVSEAVLDRERVEATLLNLDDQGDGACRLCGKWIRITDREDPVLRPPTTETGFTYPAKSRKFLSVMAYYYLDRLVEWLYSLDVAAFNKAISSPVEVDAQGVGRDDNSHFVAPVSGPVYLAFGEGGTPDATDPGVIVHEFGHALHYFLLGRYLPAGSFEEGFNDFLSCVFRDRFNEHRYDRANVFPWDNNSTVSWDPTRRCDMNFRFDDPGFEGFGFYRKGTVYASALWDIYLKIGGDSMKPGERLTAASEIICTSLDALLSVGDTSRLQDLANGLISADISRTGGRYQAEIREAFLGRGLKF